MHTHTTCLFDSPIFFFGMAAGTWLGLQEKKKGKKKCREKSCSIYPAAGERK